MMETPYKLTFTLKNNEDTHELPSIYYGIVEENGIKKCYVYGILASKNNENNRFNKKINRLLYKINDGVIDSKEYYFGNMDSHHILFSRGWSQLKPFSADSKIVQQPRSFALQSIWEEANKDTAKYSSYWSVPVVKGVY